MPDPDPTPTATQTTAAAGDAVTTKTTVKPGIYTSEFYLHLAAVILSAVLAGGIITDDRWLRIAGVVGTVLSAYGYSVTRAAIKTAAMPMLAIILLWHGSGCATTSRTTAINAVDTMTDAAGAALAAYSHQHVEAIIHSPGISAVDAKAQMTAWYARVDKAEQDLTVLRSLIKIARAQNDQPSVAALEAKATDILAELKTLEAP